MNPSYVRRKGSKSVSARWGAEELARLEEIDTSAAAAAPSAEASGAAANDAYKKRNQNKKKVSSRWGDEELSRIST